MAIENNPRIIFSNGKRMWLFPDGKTLPVISGGDGEEGEGEGSGEGEGEGNKPEPKSEETFTKAQLEDIIKQRLASERKKYEGFDDLKKKASEYDKIQQGNMSELEKLNQKLAEEQQKAEQAQAKLTSTLIKNAVMSEAVKAGAVDPDTVYALVHASSDFGNISVDDELNVTGADAVVAALLNAKPFLKSNKFGSLDTGARGTTDPTMEQLGTMSMEDYIKARKLKGI